MKYLSEKLVKQRGDHFTMVSKSENGGKGIMALSWVDRERRHFILTIGTTLSGQTIYRERMRKVGHVTKKSDHQDADYRCMSGMIFCSLTDWSSNRCRQDELKLERNFEVKECSMHVNTSFWSFAS